MNKTFTIEQILISVCDYYQIEKTEILSKNRKRKIATPRHIFYYLCREFTNASYRDLWKFTNRTKNAVIDSIYKIRMQKELYPEIKTGIEGVICIMFK
mgnify:CR=1 FL=1|tara:strand:- start:82 stop:375 length:294 start_codon:yes stop_codon:yes gene_type:complete